ncbi:MAG: FAD-binding and (Fe-S)-binding domain-containing protein [Francisellaceae bacterium]
MSRLKVNRVKDSQMLPILDQYDKLPLKYAAFTADLKTVGFQGQISCDYASRVAAAVDNSIYQLTPQLVLFPRSHEDIKMIFKLAARKAYRSLKFSARGAGTGTNGQSLCEGVMIDSSRYMNQILEIDIDKKWVRVEPGVVLDQLNEILKPLNYFFAPNLSPSNRATIGGMASTDACGKGSRIYGRTSEHLLSLSCIMADGGEIKTREISAGDFEKLCHENSKTGEIYRLIRREIIDNYVEISAQFPKMDRFMTGYNLAKTYDNQKQSVNLNYLIAGSEGTLVYITELRLKLTEIPACKQLFAISYSSFDEALRDARDLIDLNPAAIETIDDNILRLAKEDEIYPKIMPLLNMEVDGEIAAINLLEIIADSSTEIEDQIEQVKRHLDKMGRAYYLAGDQEEAESLWELRKKGVGLLGNMKGSAKPIAFMEDTAVPPQHLADYIVELRALLDGYGLKYGMFGHVDVGCLHMRPALDMNEAKDRALVVELTAEVNQLVKKYGGVYWSEHGKGFRSEYVKDYFGDDLYASLQKIKGIFDPYNQLNPGKIVVPFGSNDELVRVDGPFKGYADEKVLTAVRQSYSGAFECNGNSACLNYSTTQVMCPSAKVSRDWVYSPKGRSALLREWLFQLAKHNYIPNTIRKSKIVFWNQRQNQEDFSCEVYDSLDKCLGCKACATACPIKVDIPHMKSKFLAEYHRRYRRPWRDYMVKYVERLAFLQSKAPTVMNAVGQNSVFKPIIEKLTGFVDAPRLSKNLKVALKRRHVWPFSLSALAKLNEDEKKNTVCIVQDAFTSFYDNEVVLSCYDFLSKLGFRVYVLPFKANGKPAHVKGFLKSFEKTVKKATQFYNQVAACGVDIIGIEPSMTLAYRDEYRHASVKLNGQIELFQEWLVRRLPDLMAFKQQSLTQQAILYGHCSERSLAAVSMIHWQKIFKHFGVRLDIARVGCCGMAGVYGHERPHAERSKQIFELSWRPSIAQNDEDKTPLATGFSCRCQIKRIENRNIQHPLQYLNAVSEQIASL